LQQHTPAPYYHTERVRITRLTGHERRLVVSFTGIGKPETRQQDEEFVGYGHQGGRNHVLFVADTLRSWYNAPGIFDEIVDAVVRYREENDIEEVITFGNSMGGHGAVLFASALEAKCALALSAQFSANPKVVPEERRWMDYRSKIDGFTAPALPDTISQSCDYFILHGGGELERPHWSRFPSGPNIHHFLIGKAGHAIGRKLKSMKLMKELTRYAIAGRPRAFRLALQGGLDIRRPVSDR